MAIPSKYFAFYEQLRKHNSTAKKKLLKGGNVQNVMSDMMFAVTKDMCNMASDPSPPSGHSEHRNGTIEQAIEDVDENCKVKSSSNIIHQDLNQLKPRPVLKFNISQKQCKSESSMSMKPLTCSFAGCNKQFAREGNLNRHQLAHVNGKQYQCPESGCTKSYFDKSSLAEHSLVHSDNPTPFECPFIGCNRTFSRKSNLAQHESVHIKEDPVSLLECAETDCVKKFQNRSGLAKHQRAVHMPSRFHCTWPQCTYRTIQRANCYRHVRSFHFGLPEDIKVNGQNVVASSIRSYVHRSE